MKALKVVLVVLAVLVLIPVTIYLVVNLKGEIDAGRTRDRVDALATDRLASEVPAVASRRAAVERGVDDAPVASWIDQTCDFGTDDAGWIVQRYRETCSVDGVSAWLAVDLEAARRVADLQDAEPVEQSTGGNPCVALGDAVDGTTWTWIGAGLDLDDRGWCAGLAGSWQQHRTLDGDRLTGRTRQGLVVAATRRPLLDEPIGCTRWSVLFCDNPFGDEHAWGDPPA